MKKKTNARVATCTSIASTLKCVLALNHAGEHSSSAKGRQAPQGVTWSTADDGRVHVVTWKRGKKSGEWFDDAPAQPPAQKSSLCGVRWERGADGSRIPKDEQIACGRDPGHGGKHKGFKGAHVSEWEGNGSSGGVHMPVAATEEDEPEADDVGELEMRNHARQQREEREAHECELAAAPEPTKAVEPDGVTLKVWPGYSITGEEPKILGYRRHPAAALFRLLDGEAFTKLADSIEANGLIDEIVLVVTDDGEPWILDGSNRGRACEQRGVTPRFKQYDGPTDMDSLIRYSFDKNDNRRHDEPGVRAMIAADAAKLGRGNPGNRQTGRASGLMTQAEAGKRLGVSDRLVRRAVVVRDKATPKVKEAVMAGKLAVEAAEQLTKLSDVKQDEIADRAMAKTGQPLKGGHVRALVRQEEKRSVVRKINEQRVAPMPAGPFGVIYGDYPWLFDNSDQHEGSRGHMGYPPMEIDEILAHARDTRSRAAEDCILALWVTNWHIIKQLPQVLEAYGAEHRTVITWPKQHAGVGSWPRGQTEHLVIASIGEPVHTLNEITTLLEAYASREHSRKPDEVAELLLKHCSGPHLELFGRDQRENWIVWGAETEKFAAEAA